MNAIKGFFLCFAVFLVMIIAQSIHFLNFLSTERTKTSSGILESGPIPTTVIREYFIEKGGGLFIGIAIAIFLFGIFLMHRESRRLAKEVSDAHDLFERNQHDRKSKRKK